MYIFKWVIMICLLLSFFVSIEGCSPARHLLRACTSETESDSDKDGKKNDKVKVDKESAKQSKK